jgi:hypothetical protein
MRQDPIYDPNDDISMTQAHLLTKDDRICEWWKDEEFVKWFKNQHEFVNRLEYLCGLGLDTAEDILQSDDPKAVNAKVALIKALMEAGGKVAAKQKEVKLLDEAIHKMDKNQLEAYLKKMKLLNPVY